METVTISPDLQVPLPRSISESLRLAPGQSIEVQVRDGRIELTPVRPNGTPPAPAEPTPPLTDEEREDPLLALLGTIDSDVTDAGERHDYYLGMNQFRTLRGLSDD